MTNKYTLKDPYEWRIERDYDNRHNMVLSAIDDSGGEEDLLLTRTIHSPNPQYAQAEIVKAMDKIKQDNPELFADYVSLTDIFNDALNEIESLDDIQLSEISMSTQALAVSDDD